MYRAFGLVGGAERDEAAGERVDVEVE